MTETEGTPIYSEGGDSPPMTIPPEVASLIGPISALSLEDLVLLRQAMTTRTGARHCARNEAVMAIFSKWRKFSQGSRDVTRDMLGEHIKRTTLVQTDGATGAAVSKPNTDKTMEALEKGILKDRLEKMFNREVGPILQKWERVVRLDTSVGPCVVFRRPPDEEEETEGEAEDQDAPPPEYIPRIKLRPNRKVEWLLRPGDSLKSKLGKNYFSQKLWEDIHVCLDFIERIWKWWDNLSLSTRQNLVPHVIRTHAIVLAMISKVDGGLRWEKFNLVTIIAVSKIIKEDQCMLNYTANMTWAFNVMQEDAEYFAQFRAVEPAWVDEVRAEHARFVKYREQLEEYKQRMRMRPEQEEEEEEGESELVSVREEDEVSDEPANIVLNEEAGDESMAFRNSVNTKTDVQRRRWAQKPHARPSRPKRLPTAFPEVDDSDTETDEEMEEEGESVLPPIEGWVAGEDIMLDARCTCPMKSGSSCRCSSYPWGEDPSVLERGLSPFLRNPVPKGGGRWSDDLQFYMLDMSYGRSGDGTSIHMHAVTPEGNSVFAKIRGFDPYFFLEVDRLLSRTDISELRRRLQEVLVDAGKPPDQQIAIVKTEGVWSAHGYHEHPIPFLYRIIVKTPAFVSTLRKFLYNEDRKGPQNPLADTCGLSVERIYEANIDFTLRFCLDLDVRGSSLLSVPWDCVTKVYGQAKRSRAQIEVVFEKEDLAPVTEGDTSSRPPPFTLLSYDIECVNDDCHFPHAKNDRVSQICAVLYHPLEKRMKKIGLTLGTCDPIPGVTTLCFRTEKGLLLGWTELLRTVQPDILTGYNVDHFDNKYLHERAERLGIAEEFADYSRMKGKWYHAKVVKSVFQSSAAGKIVSYRHSCQGMVTMDVLTLARRDFGLRLGSYTLNSVSSYLFGGQKDDVHYSEIPRLCAKSSYTRSIVTKYCVQDCVLPAKIIEKRDYYVAYIMLSRITRTFLRYLIEKGQTAKVKSQIVAQAKLMHMVVPTLRPEEINRRSYEGAYVEFPLCGYYGFHEDTKTTHKQRAQGFFAESSVRTDRVALLEGMDNPMTVMDFSSLYPSIIIGYNLCYSTKTTLAKIREMGWVECRDYNRTPCGAYFVTARIRKGLLPIICENLLTARAKEKKLMAAAKKRGDMAAYSVHNNNQNAIKVSANSVYGFTGAFFWTDRDISESITLYGQYLIKKVRSSVVASVRPDKVWKKTVRAIPGSWRDVAVRLAMKGHEVLHYNRSHAPLVVGKCRGVSEYRPSWVVRMKALSSDDPAFGDEWARLSDSAKDLGLEAHEQMVSYRELPFSKAWDYTEHQDELMYVCLTPLDDSFKFEKDECFDQTDWSRTDVITYNVTQVPSENIPYPVRVVHFPRQSVPVYGDTDSVMMVVSGGEMERHEEEIVRRMRKQLVEEGREHLITSVKTVLVTPGGWLDTAIRIENGGGTVLCPTEDSGSEFFVSTEGDAAGLSNHGPDEETGSLVWCVQKSGTVDVVGLCGSLDLSDCSEFYAYATLAEDTNPVNRDDWLFFVRREDYERLARRSDIEDFDPEEEVEEEGQAPLGRSSLDCVLPYEDLDPDCSTRVVVPVSNMDSDLLKAFGAFGVAYRFDLPVDEEKALWRKIYERILVEESYEIAIIAAARATVEINVEIGHVPEFELYSERPWIDIVKQYWPPIRIIPEEIYFPFVLLGKKKYFGNMYLSPTQEKPYYTAKGIETKRRDNFKFMRDCVKLFNDILIEDVPTPDGFTKIDYAIAEVQRMLRNLLAGRVSCYDLVRSASLKRPVDEYKSDPPHRNLTIRDMKERPGSEAHTGDRVHWIITKGPSKKVADRAEHPDVVMRDRLPVDYEYYADCTLKAVCRVLAALIGPATFEGIDYDHWSKKQIEDETKQLIKVNNDFAMKVLRANGALIPAEPKRRVRRSGGISRFIRNRPRCVKCQCVIGSRAAPPRSKRRRLTNTKFRGVHLCGRCMGSKKDMLSDLAHKRYVLEQRLYSAKAKCLNCQGEIFGTVECPIVECPTFFSKVELSNDIEDLDAMLTRLVPMDGHRRRKSPSAGDDEKVVLHKRVAKDIMN